MNEKEHILIVDDDPNIAKSLAIILQQHGYQTSKASTGHDALESARRSPFRVILLDIRLPDVQGLDLIRPLKDLLPDCSVVMITAYASMETAVHAVNEGASGYLKKPFGISDVLDAVRQALGQQKRTVQKTDDRLSRERRDAQEALQRSHDWFRMLFHRGNDPIFVHGVTSEGLPGRFLEVNDLACHSLGYDREELLALSPLEIDGSADRAVSRWIMDQLLSDKSCVAEQVHVAKDGRRLLVETNSHLFELNGRPLVLSIARDISSRKRAEEALQHSEERWRSLVENVPDTIMTIGRDGRIQFANRPWPSHPDSDLMGTSVYDWVLPEHEQRLRTRIERVFTEGRATSLEFAVQGKKSRTMWYEARVGPVGPEAAPAGCIMIITDTTERKRAEERREASHRLLRVANRHADLDTLLTEYVAEVKRLVNCQAAGIVLLDENNLVVREARDGFSRHFAVTPRQDSPCTVPPACARVLRQVRALNPPFRTNRGSFVLNSTSQFLSALSERRRAKACRLCNLCGYESVALVPIREADTLLGFVHLADPREDAIAAEALGVLEDAALQLATSITRSRTRETLAHLATHDALTGLPTRVEFDRLLGRALAHAREDQHAVAVMVADVDHFKHVNDSLGHDAGDRVLVTVGERLGSVLRHGDSVSRIGGDEFVLLLRGLGDPQDAVPIASKLLRRVQEPIVVDGHALHVTISIGIASCPRDGEDGRTLFRHADTAMYRAKNAGRNTFQWYDRAANPALA